MKLKISSLIPSAALLCVVLASCKKNEAVTSAVSSSTNSPLTKTTSMIGAMSNETDLDVAAALVSADKVSSPSDCPVKTYNPSKDVYPNTKTIDYGSGCTDENGVTRSGKRLITVYADEDMAPAGKVVSVATFSNYYVNGVNITGNVKISVVAPASSGNLVLRVVSNKTVTDMSGNTSSFVSVITQKQVSGGGDSLSSNDVFQVIESSYGTEVLGDSSMVVWNSKTDPSNPVMKMASCSFRSQGALMLNLKTNGVPTTEYLDYGNGDCDDQATLTINGVTQAITLPFYFFDPHL